jgi:serine phosphatase RsbU (regulator of sigma subunit)
MKAICICLSFVFLLNLPIQAQESINKLIDSVKTLVLKAREDTHKVTLLSELSYRLRNSNADTSIFLAKQALQLANKLQFKTGKALATHDLAAAYLFSDDYKQAIYYNKLAQETLTPANTRDEKWILGMVLNTFGRIYIQLANYAKALDYLIQSLKVRESIQDQLGVAQSYHFIATIYLNQKDFTKALANHQKALEIRDKYQDYQGLAQTYNSIGAIHRHLNDFPKAYSYFQKALDIDTKLQNQYGIAYDLSSMASLLAKEQKNEKALELHQKALKIREKIEDHQGMVFCLNRIAQLQLRFKDIDLALQSAKRGLDIAQKYNISRDRIDSYYFIAAAYEAKKDFGQAYIFQKKWFTLKDSVFNIDKQKELTVLQSSYDLEKKQTEIDILNRDKIIQKEQIEAARLRQWIYILGLVSIAVFAFVVFRYNRRVLKFYNVLKEKNKIIDNANEELKLTNEELNTTLDVVARQKDLIEKKNEDITASIMYAKRIQTAMLPFEERMERNLGENNFFILYKPRDIVSGDFYWFEEIENEALAPDVDELFNPDAVVSSEKVSKLVFAVVDCTGHGIPGAFMSMIANELLNEIVIEKNITSPDLILNHLHRGIRYALKQDQTDSRDGMDISICTLDKLTHTLEFAGASNPLFLLKNNELEIIKADKMSIGGTVTGKERLFNKNLIQIESPTTLYLFSDGYQDQFGGPQNRKFMTKQFRELLCSIHLLDMPQQKEILDKTIMEWMGEYSQTDDITVMGLRL